MTNRRIVIYSPHRDTSFIVEEIAKYAQCEVECCTTPRQTINAVFATKPFLVIILSICPIINGTKFIKQLRAVGEPASAKNSGQRPTIFVIAWQHAEQTVLSMLEEGVDQYITFPICANRLYGKISTLLKNARQ